MNLETLCEAPSKLSREVAVRLGHQTGNYSTFAELRGSKDDVIDVLLAGLCVFAVGALIYALLRG